MGYSSQVVKKVREEFEHKREKAVRLSKEHQEQAYAKCPVLREIDMSLAATGLSVFKASIGGSEGLEERIKAVKEENRHLQETKRQLLKTVGLPEDFTDIKYQCDKCNDTGYIGVDMCKCMKKALVKEAYLSSGLGKMLTTQTFSNFSLDYYNDERIGTNASDRENMEAIVASAKAYVSDFGKSGRESNMFFMGTTGLGKTHITTAIAKGVIDKGYDVVYDSVMNIVRAFEMERFEKDEYAKGDVSRYFDCDLLIIDDLGTEMQNSFTQSCIYNLVNTRINSDMPMIVSSNISDTATLLKEYDRRITSRFIGSFKFYKFVGQDIRIQKTKKAKQNNI